jgi:hypothetical protein
MTGIDFGTTNSVAVRAASNARRAWRSTTCSARCRACGPAAIEAHLEAPPQCRLIVPVNRAGRRPARPVGDSAHGASAGYAVALPWPRRG